MSLPVWAGGDRAGDLPPSLVTGGKIHRPGASKYCQRASVCSAHLVCTLVAVCSASEGGREGNENRGLKINIEKKPKQTQNPFRSEGREWEFLRGSYR